MGFNKRDFYFSFDKKEIKIPIGSTSQVSVLINDGVYWDPAVRSFGDVSSNAVIGGKAKNGALYYIGRVQHEYVWTPGKIDPPNQRLYISYDGVELECNNYEVLVKTMQSTGQSNEKTIRRQWYNGSELNKGE